MIVFLLIVYVVCIPVIFFFYMNVDTNANKSNHAKTTVYKYFFESNKSEKLTNKTEEHSYASAVS